MNNSSGELESPVGLDALLAVNKKKNLASFASSCHGNQSFSWNKTLNKFGTHQWKDATNDITLSGFGQEVI